MAAMDRQLHQENRESGEHIKSSSTYTLTDPLLAL